MMDFSSPRQPRSCVWAWPGREFRGVRPLKNHSRSPGVRAPPTILARSAPLGGNPAHPARCAAHVNSLPSEPWRPGAGRDAHPRLRARVRTASWEARAQLILAMETGAVLEASGQLLVRPHPSSGRSSQPTSAGEMRSKDVLVSPLPCGGSRYVRPQHTWDFVAALVSTPGYCWVPSAFNTSRKSYALR